MKVIWKAEDIVPGRRYSKEGIKEEWIIGYLSNNYGDNRYVSISDQDGMVTAGTDKESLAARLTEGGYIPVELLKVGIGTC